MAWAFLNGEPISEEIICDGDEILAGTSKFTVHIAGGIPAAQRKIQGVTGGQQPDLSAELAGIQFDLPPLARPCSYTAFPCRSGLSLFRGSQCHFDPAAIAERLSHVAPMYVVVDASKLGTITQDPSEAASLFEGLPQQLAVESSPLVFGPSQDSDLSTLVEGGWSHDGLICLYSRTETSVLMEHLREFSHEHVESPPTQELAYFRPMTMAEFLSNGEPDAVANLLLGIDAVFMEVHGGERWAVFSDGGFGTILERIDVLPTPAWET